MKFIRPNALTSASRGGERVSSRPQWLKEWIEDQPEFVQLSCTHKMDINIRSVTVVQRTFGKRHVLVWCDVCNAFARIAQRLTLLEYHGIIAAEIPDVPLF